MNSFYILISLSLPPIVLYFSVVTIVFLHCVAQSPSEAKHNLYCQDRCYKMKLNMADVERVVCLQMITCHNMFLWFFFFFWNAGLEKKARWPGLSVHDFDAKEEEEFSSSLLD